MGHGIDSNSNWLQRTKAENSKNSGHEGSGGSQRTPAQTEGSQKGHLDGENLMFPTRCGLCPKRTVHVILPDSRQTFPLLQSDTVSILQNCSGTKRPQKDGLEPGDEPQTVSPSPSPPAGASSDAGVSLSSLCRPAQRLLSPATQEWTVWSNSGDSLRPEGTHGTPPVAAVLS